MTKVILTESLLNYRREMADLVRQTVKESFIEGVKSLSLGSEESFPSQADLLLPPRIEVIELSLYHGHIGDPIFFATSDDFGIWNVHVVIKDVKGNLIESGDASQFEDCADYWDYLATVSIPAGTCVRVYVSATDGLWCVGLSSAGTTMP